MVKRIKIKDDPMFEGICMEFYFKQTKIDKEPNVLLFARQDSLLEYNFESEEAKLLCTFEVPLNRYPEFFLMNEDQTVSIIASVDDGIYFNHKTR